MMDGLKPSQRKVLYGSLLKNIKDEIKVDQLRGFIGEKAAYHHGEMSLNETIMGMNANYVGSNNINLFKPGGQLGTRLMGGKDAASLVMFSLVSKKSLDIYLKQKMTLY